MPSHTTHNTPALRFPGYTGVWEQRRFNELASVRRGLTYKPSDVYKSGVRVLRSSNISEDSFNISPDDIFVHNSAINIPFIKNGDILVTAANGSSRLVGKHAIVHNVPENSAVPGGFMLCLSSSEPNFLNASMSTSWYSKFIHTFVAGGNGSIGNISKSSLDTQFILVPSLDEQKKIGSFFSKLDSIIGLHQRQTKQLKKPKQGLLQAMFPREGESVPRLRFPGFTTHWEQHKVQDIYKITRGYVLAAPETNKNPSDDMPYPVYSSQTKNNGLMGYYKDYLYEDAITWTTDGANAGTVHYRAGRFYCTNVCGVLLSEEGYANKCAAEALNNVAWRWVSHVGNPKLMNNVMGEIPIRLPVSIEEQNQISRFLEEIDNLIGLHEQYVTTLIHLKKGLLQKMFPQD